MTQFVWSTFQTHQLTLTIFLQISIENSSLKLWQLPACLKLWKVGLHRRKMKTRVCHTLQAHGASVVIQPATQAITQWIIFIILNTGNFLCCYDPNCWRTEWTTNKNTSGETSKENYEWNIWRTFVARLCFDPFDSENCSLSRGNLYSLAVKENKLFVMTFKCLQFIPCRVVDLVSRFDENLNRWCSHHQ